MKLSEVISINKKNARSVNLERDKSELDVINSYQVTGKAQEVIERFVAAMGDEKVSAWSLIGPYGMGKSAFLNFFTKLTGPHCSKLTQTALKKLEDEDKNLHDRFIDRIMYLSGETGFFQIPIVAAFEPINTTLARGLLKAVSQSGLSNKRKIAARLEMCINNSSIDSAVILSLFEEVLESVQVPLVLIVDELGKNLEYLSCHSHNGDLFILQQLAEMDKVYLFVCLHQAFDEYLSGFSIVQQQEWNKVQGRFEEISYIESTPQMLYLIQSVVEQKDMDAFPARIKEWAVEIESALELSDIGKGYLDVNIISDIYPLHPLTGLALVELCRRYAQNERTLLSFLTSGHISALPAQMERITLNQGKALPAIALDSLYDYFFQLSNTSLAGRPSAQRWVEIHDNLQAIDQFSSGEALLLKNIGVLNLLAGILGLKADYHVISSIMEYSYCWTSEDVRKTLDSLTRRGVIFYREYRGEYRLWEGSDFDVNEVIANEKSQLSVGSLEEILESSLPLSPIIAARHSLKTGNMRKFERRWIDVESLEGKLTPHPGFDGLLLYCFGTGKEPHNVPQTCADQRPLIVAYAPVKDTLTELALELVSCKRVLELYPQLTHDKVARKEVSYRLRVARERFREYLLKAFSPGAVGLVWYEYEGKIQISNSRKLSEKISERCDKCYDNAPEIPNEIVSGEKLSSAAVRARRELVEAMATKAEEKNLGFTGWGPEVAMYRSLLLTKDLHRKNPKTGSWYLSLEGSEPSIIKVWEEFNKLIEEADDIGITVEDMLNALRECPFGLKQGPAMIYISLYLLVKAENLTIFREGIYHPYLTAADMALLLKRPELFTVKRFMVNDLQKTVFAVYRAVLKKSQLKIDSNLRNATMLGVIGPLMKFVDNLPRHSKQTRDISKQAQQVRAAITNAVDPLRFLFEDLPAALDIKVNGNNTDLWSKELERNLQMALEELEQVHDKLNKKIQKALLYRFACSSLEQLYAAQRKAAQNLLTICDASDLKPMLQAMSRKESILEDWVKGIAGAIVKRPVDCWKDEDYAIFKTRLADYVDRIEQLEALAAVDKSENAQVISVMRPGGDVKRVVVSAITADPELDDILNGIMELPEDKYRVVLALLANKLF